MNIFVYGTLLVPEIWNLVTECPDLKSAEATLFHHSIWRVRDATFPAIVEEPRNPESSVPGKVYFDIPMTALQRLDLYEDAFYERIEVEVETESGTVKAQAYRAPRDNAHAIISGESWTLEWFEKNGLDDFLKNVFDH